VPVISQQQCQLQMQQTRLGYDYKLHPGMICAGGEEGKDACKVTHSFSKIFLGSFPKLQKVTLRIVMSVTQSARKNSAPSGQMFVEYDTAGPFFFENMLRKLKFP